MHNESASPELPSILHGALIALAALALSFIATALALEPRAPEHKARGIASDIRR
jgi:hypothetical protein